MLTYLSMINLLSVYLNSYFHHIKILSQFKDNLNEESPISLSWNFIEVNGEISSLMHNMSVKKCK